jgi:hypothetical protein
LAALAALAALAPADVVTRHVMTRPHLRVGDVMTRPHLLAALAALAALADFEAGDIV